MTGRCVICGRICRLTRDHVPPRGVVPPRALEIRRLTAAIQTGPPFAESPRRGFQAPVFPSLCSVCNTDKLGSVYDPELIVFANSLAAWVRGASELGLTLPDVAVVNLRPLDVARAVVGHLLAAEERSNPVAPLVGGSLLEEMRSYFLGAVIGTPAFRIFVWPYAGSDLVIARGFALARVLGRAHGPVVGDVLKFFPLAFWVVGSAPDDVDFPFAELPLAEGNEVTLEIPMRRVPRAQWPERPGDQEVIVLAGERTHVARSTARPRRAT